MPARSAVMELANREWESDEPVVLRDKRVTTNWAGRRLINGNHKLEFLMAFCASVSEAQAAAALAKLDGEAK